MKQTLAATLFAACAVFGAGQAATAEDVSLVFQNQHVTLVARDIPVSRILARWSQIGGTVVVNGAAVQGGPISLQLTDVTEREALDILLRGVDGYIVAGRDDGSTGVSSISKILILSRGASPRNPPPLLAATFDASGDSRPVDAQAEQTFVAPAENVVQPVPPPSLAAPSAAAGFVPIISSAGATRPGDVTPQLPPVFKPGSAATAQPGQAPPPVPTIPTSHPPVPPGTIVP